MTKQLRPHQIKAQEILKDAYRRGVRSVCCVAPTGSGKTLIGARVAIGAAKKGNSVLWLCHRAELIAQTKQTIQTEEPGLDVGCISPLFEPNRSAKIQIASIQTLLSRDEMPDASIVVFDECHHLGAEKWGEYASKYDSSFRIGLTATPARGDGVGLGDLFQELHVIATVKEMIQQGFLVPCRVFTSEDISKDLALDPVQAWREYGNSLPAVVFATSVEHAEKLEQDFLAAGAKAAVIHSKTHPMIREQRLRDFEAGKIDVLTNCFVLTEGTDLPRIHVVISARTIGNISMYRQMIGRGLRLYPGKKQCIYIDLCGSVKKFGLPDDEPEWTLKGLQRSKADTDSITICWKCHAAFRDGYPCPNCGASARTNRRELPVVTNKGLVSYGFPDKDDEFLKQKYFEYSYFAKAKGYKPGFAYYRFRNVFGCSPNPEWQREVWGEAWQSEKDMSVVRRFWLKYQSLKQERSAQLSLDLAPSSAADIISISTSTKKQEK